MYMGNKVLQAVRWANLGMLCAGRIIMSRHKSEVMLPLSIDQALMLCKEAVAELGWKVISNGNAGFVCKEETPRANMWGAQTCHSEH